MKKIIYIFCFCLLIISCKKNQLGGKSVIKGKVAHHGFGIADSKVYIKFNAKEFPGMETSKYDSFVTADSEGNYTIDCYKGDYYLYGVGFDKRSSEIVSGGLAVHIRHKETREMEIAVTE